MGLTRGRGHGTGKGTKFTKGAGPSRVLVGARRRRIASVRRAHEDPHAPRFFRKASFLRVALDVRPALSRPTGVGVYIGAIARALPPLDPDSRFTLFTSSLRERWSRDDREPNVDVVDRRVPVRALNFAWSRLDWPSIETLCGRDFDILHSPHALLTPSKRARRIISIHDLFFFKHPEMTANEIRRDYAPLVQDHAHRADGIICPSEHTARDIERLLHVPRRKICVTLYGINSAFRIAPSDADVASLLARLGLPHGGLLYVGSEEKRKNLPTLVSAYRRLTREMDDAPPLVLVGPGTSFGRPGRSDLNARAGDVVSTGYLETHEIRALMSASACLVLASLEEGFGLPVAEAMSAGLPVVCSRGSSLEEIAGGAAELIDDPLSEDAIVRSLRHVLEHPTKAESMRALGLARSNAFDWSRTAEMTLAFYRKVVGS